MADIIKKHNFDNALGRIRNFANSTPSIPSIEKFKTSGGLFGWGAHKVTGDEMNRYVETVQDIFEKQNSVLISAVKEFQEVYTTFDYLDKEYLQGILGAVEAARTASNGAKLASDQAKDAAGRALKNEADIRKEIEALRRVVEKIKTIKEDLTGKIARLEINITQNKRDIMAEMYNRTISASEMNALKNRVAAINGIRHISDIEDMWDNLKRSNEQLNSLQGFANSLMESNHLFDIDEIWMNVEELWNVMNNLHADILQHEGDIKEKIDNLSSAKVLEISNELDGHIKTKLKESEKQLQSLSENFINQIEELAHHLSTLEQRVSNYATEYKQSIDILRKTLSECNENHSSAIKKLENSIDTQYNNTLIQINQICQTTIEYRAEYTSSITRLESKTDELHEETQRQVVEIRETASEQREELSAAISALGEMADARAVPAL